MATGLGLTEVAADVFELRLPIPFEDGLVNVFLFPDGDVADLVDCGMNTDESVTAITGIESGHPLFTPLVETFRAVQSSRAT